MFKTVKAIVLDTCIFNVFYDNMLYSRVHNKVLCYYVLKRIPKLGLWRHPPSTTFKIQNVFFSSVCKQEEHSWAWYSVTCALSNNKTSVHIFLQQKKLCSSFHFPDRHGTREIPDHYIFYELGCVSQIIIMIQTQIRFVADMFCSGEVITHDYWVSILTCQ